MARQFIVIARAAVVRLHLARKLGRALPMTPALRLALRAARPASIAALPSARAAIAAAPLTATAFALG